MRYNRDFARLKFSTDQIIDSATCDRLMQEHNDFSQSMLTADIKKLNSMMNGTPMDEEESPLKKIFGWILGVIFIGGMIAVIACAVMKNLVLLGYIFSGLFLMAGILMLFGKASMPFNTANALPKTRVTGVYLVCTCSAIIALIAMRGRFLDAELFVWIISVAFGMSGLWLLATALIDMLSGRIIYREAVAARCTGYVRFVDYDNSANGGGHHSRFTYIYTSPVFEYSYNGMKYESLYDVFPLGTESDIPYETVTTIKIDPKNPSNVFSPETGSTARFVLMLIMAVMFTAVGSGLAWYTLAGNVADKEVQVEWNPLIERMNSDEPVATEPSSPQITDEWIEETYASSINGKEWYYETVTIKEIETEDNEMILYFDDEGAYALWIDKDDSLDVGESIEIFYTLSDDTEEADYGYKSIFTYAKPGEIQYAGSHGAYISDK